MRTFALSALVLACTFGSVARADDADGGGRLVHEWRFGVSMHDLDGLWSGFKEEEGTDFGLEVIFEPELFTLWSGVARPNLGVSINNQGDTSKVYAGFLWTRTTDSGWFFSLGLDLAAHNGSTETDRPGRKQLGSHVLLRIPIEAGYDFKNNHRVALVFDHISNAWLFDENEGLDTLGLFYSYRY